MELFDSIEISSRHPLERDLLEMAKKIDARFSNVQDYERLSEEAVMLGLAARNCVVREQSDKIVPFKRFVEILNKK